MINAAFIYVAPGQNPQEQKAVIPSETLTLHPVGAVKFDYHPAFGFKSGDELFQ